MYDGINKRNANDMLKDWDAKSLDYGDGSDKPMPLDSVKSMMSTWFTAFPDFKGENLQYVAEGDMVMVYGDYSGTWKADLMGQKPTGKQFKMHDADVYKLNADGKIIEHRNVQPFSAIAQQVGMKMQ